MPYCIGVLKRDPNLENYPNMDQNKDPKIAALKDKGLLLGIQILMGLGFRV